MKIIAFPFAGGNKYSFNFLKEYLFKDKIDLKALEYPGRGQRMEEGFLNNMEAIVDDAFIKIITEIGDEDYIIYGHSMGALVSYLICKKIMVLSLKLPLKLIVSGRSSPSMGKEEKTCQLSSTLFWKKVDNLGGIPNELFQDDSIRDFLNQF